MILHYQWYPYKGSERRISSGLSPIQTGGIAPYRYVRNRRWRLFRAAHVARPYQWHEVLILHERSYDDVILNFILEAEIWVYFVVFVGSNVSQFLTISWHCSKKPPFIFYSEYFCMAQYFQSFFGLKIHRVDINREIEKIAVVAPFKSAWCTSIQKIK